MKQQHGYAPIIRKSGTVLLNIANEVHQPASKANVLTVKEEELLQYCCNEFTYREIAAKMICSPGAGMGTGMRYLKSQGLRHVLALRCTASRSGVTDASRQYFGALILKPE